MKKRSRLKRPVSSANPADLKEFLRLVASPIRSKEREVALRAWETYKLGQQKAYTIRDNAQRSEAVVQRWKAEPRRRAVLQKFGTKAVLKSFRTWRKGDYERSLTAPAIDLRGATFRGVCLGYADLRGVRFDGAKFMPGEQGLSAMKGAKLVRASLKGTQLPGMRLMEAGLRDADLTQANLVGADLSQANLQGAILRGTNLSGANLERANLVGADVEGCRLDSARVYGVSAWDLRGSPKSSRDLIVTPSDAPTVTADDIRVAQFIYLLINNPSIRDVLDTVTQKVVLLLGRFRPERKAVLDALRDALRHRNFVPVLFDFDKPSDRDLTETVTLLARMARFVIADLTDPASIPQELDAVAPHVEVPVRLIIAEGHKPYSMSKDLQKYHWVIRPYRYKGTKHLLATLGPEVIDVAEAKRIEIQRNRADREW